MKGVTRLLLLGGAVAIGLFLFRAAPRDVTLVYGLSGMPAQALEVDIRRGAETVRHAEFRFGAGAPPTVSHRVRLTDGDYVVAVTVFPPSTAAAGAIDAGAAQHHLERPIQVSESGTIVIPLGS